MTWPLTLSGITGEGITVAFTGTRAFKPDPHASIVDMYVRDLARLAHDGIVAEFVSGAAIGWDTYIAVALEKGCPATRHRLVVPDAPHNEGLVGRWEYWAKNTPQHHIVERMPEVATHDGKGRQLSPSDRARKAYRERDQRMVDLAKAGRGCLVGVALHEERRMPYSGTWLTIRLARQSDVPVYRIILDPNLSLLDELAMVLEGAHA